MDDTALEINRIILCKLIRDSGSLKWTLVPWFFPSWVFNIKIGVSLYFIYFFLNYSALVNN